MSASVVPVALAFLASLIAPLLPLLPASCVILFPPPMHDCQFLFGGLLFFDENDIDDINIDDDDDDDDNDDNDDDDDDEDDNDDQPNLFINFDSFLFV